MNIRYATKKEFETAKENGYKAAVSMKYVGKRDGYMHQKKLYYQYPGHSFFMVASNIKVSEMIGEKRGQHENT